MARSEAPPPPEGWKMAEGESETDVKMAEGESETDVILVETSSSQLIAALRTQGYRRFNEPRITICGRSFPIFFVPLMLFFVLLFG